MITGIVEMMGRIQAIQEEGGCRHFCIVPERRISPQLGDSIIVNGVCLTVTVVTEDSFSVTVVPETLRITTLGKWQEGDFVNLEQSMTAVSRFGGHFVEGHVDGVGKILELEPDDNLARMVKISFPPPIAPYLVPKGFIAVDGMSLTVVSVGLDWFTVTFIPHTLHNTIVQYYKVGQAVNLEGDMIAKHIDRILTHRLQERSKVLL